MIEVSDVTVTFNRGTPLQNVALRDVSLSVPDGQFLTVIGSNGAGKTTSLNVIAGSVKPDAGNIVVAGTDVTQWPVYRRAKLIARVFQDPKMGRAKI